MKDLWSTISRYPRFLLIVIAGVFFALFGWSAPLWKRPTTAIAMVVFLVAGISFIVLTLQAMLGLNAA
jgi:hypothetical protein